MIQKATVHLTSSTKKGTCHTSVCNTSLVSSGFPDKSRFYSKASSDFPCLGLQSICLSLQHKTKDYKQALQLSCPAMVEQTAKLCILTHSSVSITMFRPIWYTSLTKLKHLAILLPLYLSCTSLCTKVPARWLNVNVNDCTYCCCWHLCVGFFFTADILTYHSMKGTSATNNIISGSVLFMYPINPWQCDSEPAWTMPGSWNWTS